MSNPHDDRSALAKAMVLVSTITTVALEMVLPVLAGYWLDQRLGWTPILVIAGAAFGLVLGLWQLIQMGRPAGRRRPD